MTAAARLKAIDIPLERDEGEYAYGGQLLLQGVPPYAAAYNMKFPGIYAAYAVILAVFGESTRGIHLGLLVVNAASILLVYVLGAWLSGRLAGVIAAASYALLSASPSVLGLAGHATHFVVLTCLAGVWLLIRARDRDGLGTLVAGGFALGLALLMKQHAVFFALFGLAHVGWSSRAGRGLPWSRVVSRAGAVALGILLPVAGTLVYLGAAGVHDRFWFWCVEYARVYAGQVSPSEGWASFLHHFPRAVGPALPLWLLALAGLIAMARRGRRDRALWITGFTLASFAATIPGFWFREHYFIVLLPAVAMLAGGYLVGMTEVLSRDRLPPAWRAALCALVFLLASAPAAGSLRALLAKSPEEMSRALYGSNPFPESVSIARYIASNSGPDARVAVLGSEPQIYFHSGRRSATGYIYTYGLMERVPGPRDPATGKPTWLPQPYARRMHEEMIREIEAAEPEYIVFVQVYTSWLANPESDQHIMEWSRGYVAERYDLVGTADILENDTEYRWGHEAASSEPRSEERMYVFRLKRSILAAP
ncbi:MAG TPA: glycosyltransferase family 39 protein [Candidatus Eisenbacteria bacterium]|nr:glycosyltransferase family 39 protein [Candidatus Eisenbacteria bacterium]